MGIVKDKMSSNLLACSSIATYLQYFEIGKMVIKQQYVLFLLMKLTYDGLSAKTHFLRLLDDISLYISYDERIFVVMQAAVAFVNNEQTPVRFHTFFSSTLKDPFWWASRSPPEERQKSSKHCAASWQKDLANKNDLARYYVSVDQYYAPFDYNVKDKSTKWIAKAEMREGRPFDEGWASFAFSTELAFQSRCSWQEYPKRHSAKNDFSDKRDKSSTQEVKL